AFTPKDLLQNILSVEESMGRVRTTKNAARIIDIDILFYDDKVVEKEGLQIPHAAIPYRRFVLEPLNEICPNFLHPVVKKTIVNLLKECTDPLQVKRY
ncbi:MAG: 2-amino-4-hydroxy-6-hydroxymethyldihydropteridine diphosphokinase, partial [Ferruginibacter sp.]